MTNGQEPCAMHGRGLLPDDYDDDDYKSDHEN